MVPSTEELGALAFPTEYNNQVAAQAAGQATLFAAQVTGLATYVTTTSSTNCTASRNARTAIHAAYVANGNTGPDPAVPGCTP